MSNLRFDVTTNEWVIFAPTRAHRPEEMRRPATADAASTPAKACPFCPGNERLTPPEIMSLPADAVAGKAGWRVRVVPNKFPALRIEDEPLRTADGVFQSMGGCGAHEVIIESPAHDTPLARQPVEQIELVLRAMQWRMNDLLRDQRFQMIVLFKNHGEGAGTSLRHPHCQLIATPVVPRVLRLKHALATDHFDRTGSCLYCAMLAEELAAGQRVLAENDQYAAFMPFASHVPFETWIAPRMHQSSFGSVELNRFRKLAELLKLVLLKLDVGLNNPDFNLTVNTVPRGDEDKDYFLWHIAVLPRLATPAGFELGSGMSINTVMPEDATDYLRQVSVS